MGFQFKKELADKITKGPKRQTRRPFKNGDESFPNGDSAPVYRNERLLWQKGRTYAIQPGRGKKGVGFLTITGIRFEHVWNISQEDAIAEGFTNRIEFLQVWCSFYDPQVEIKKSRDGWDVCYRLGKAIAYEWHDRSEAEVIEGLKTRPRDLYYAHVIEFELVKAAEAVQS